MKTGNVLMIVLALAVTPSSGRSVWPRRAAPAVAQEKEGVAVTVYNGGYAVVREVRRLDIGRDKTVKFTDVAKRIDPTTVYFKSLTDPNATLLEQNYQYDLVSADKLLDKYIDRQIEVVTDKSVYKGKLLSFDGRQIVLDKDGDGIVMVQRADNVRDIRFSELPGGLLTRPTLVWLVATDKPGKQLAEVTYQTGGMGWHAEYVMVLGDKDTTADLSGWVSVDNKSGKTYRDAKLKFIAGDVRRLRPPAPRVFKGMAVERLGRRGTMEEKAFFEYHMYTLPRPSTVADNEVKQLEMFPPARNVKVKKRFIYRGVGKKAEVWIEFKNEKANALGMPLPAGKVRVFKQDPDDKALEFVGEERIDHTPTNEKLELMIGRAFDIVCERKRVAFRSRGRWSEEKVEILIRNRKTEAVQIEVKLNVGTNWQITEKSRNFVKKDASTILFRVTAKPNVEEKITYTLERNW